MQHVFNFIKIKYIDHTLPGNHLTKKGKKNKIKSQFKITSLMVPTKLLSST